MNFQYDLKGCISFDETEYSISIPILTERSSNRIFIPKTDVHFNVLDFYVIEDFDYPIKWLNSKQVSTVKIGDKCPVPIIVDEKVYLIDPTYDIAEIRRKHPELIEAAIKAFVSLRDRTKLSEWDFVETFPRDLTEPVRSRYWVSKYLAYVRSKYESSASSEFWLGTATKIRDVWIEKFAHKAQFRMVDDLFKLKELPMSHVEQDKILVARFDKLFRSKAFNIPATEVSAYEERFSEGIINAAKRFDDGAAYTAWEMQSVYSRIISTYCESLRSRHAPGTGDLVWNITFLELTKMLRVIRLLANDEFHFSSALYQLEEMLASGTNSLRSVADSAFGMSNYSEFKRRNLQKNLIEMFGLGAGPLFLGQRANFVSDRIEEKMFDYYRKLLILNQIVHPHLRHADINEIAIEGIHVELFDRMGLRRRVWRNK